MTVATKVKRRTGRRPGESGTREAIAQAARRQFAELGYEPTTIRAIADEAGVDPALVMHFFDSKQKLFFSVMTLPFEPEKVMPEILAGRRSQLGLRYARFAIGLFEDPRARGVMTGYLRAAASEPSAARMVRDQVTGRIVDAIAKGLGDPDGRLRADLVVSQIIGLVMARYIIRVEPLASLPPEALIGALAPNLQRYLTGRLESTPAESR
jgi:AcrR family transcriptional regulator